MRERTSARGAFARVAGVRYLAKSRRLASAVRSSRVRCERIVEMSTRNGSCVSAATLARAVPGRSRKESSPRYFRRSPAITRRDFALSRTEGLQGLPADIDLARDHQH